MDRLYEFMRNFSCIHLNDDQGRMSSFYVNLIDAFRYQRNIRVTDYNTDGIDRNITRFGDVRELTMTSCGLTEKIIASKLKTRIIHDVTKPSTDDDDDKTIVEEEEICAICFDNLYQENETIARLDCRHEYHSDCINEIGHNVTVRFHHGGKLITKPSEEFGVL
ncbi:hypothetical protein BUALT_BualtUnG0048700 [Buddleja alternifolia]|uniref:RING-type E3 ubiquitin transferase n=1 Tax=Buddleja alternifolia TaxID=168488 RepID=A0AAV6W505_9LAMI|nr:hypothetical protein BUALT_BualtUnG0048700 [Buddleja alternifolia]